LLALCQSPCRFENGRSRSRITCDLCFHLMASSQFPPLVRIAPSQDANMFSYAHLAHLSYYGSSCCERRRVIPERAGNEQILRDRHDLTTAGNRAERISVRDGFAEGRQVRNYAIKLLSAA